MRLNKENTKYIEKIIRQIINKRKTIKYITSQIRTSRQTIAKWVKKYKKEGKLTNRINAPKNKYSNEYNQKIVSYFKSVQDDISSRFKGVRKEGEWKLTIRLLKDLGGFSCSKKHIRTVLLKENIVVWRTQRKTRKKIKKRLEHKLKTIVEEKKKDEILEAINKIEEQGIYHGKTGAPGFRMEIDACEDHWFDHEKCHLYLSVDTFTGTVLDFWWEKEETNIGYFNLLWGSFIAYGLPEEMRSDCRNGLRQGKIKDAVERMNIKFDSSTNPTFKPNVERAFESAQSFLPIFLMQNKINTPAEALHNKEIILKALNEWNNNFINIDNNVFRKMKIDDINKKFYIKFTRKVVNQISHISYKGKMIAPYKNSKRMLMNKEVTIYCNTSGEIYTLYNGQKAYFKEITN